MLFREHGEIERLEEGGPVVGLLPACVYREGAVTLAPGDLLVGFTDGISESMNAAEEEWGENAIVETVQLLRNSTSAKILEGVMHGASAFAGDAPPHDDMTLVILKRALGNAS
jgi:sigma-B regulation protein RsbU (phosphoserine phosphatase)